MTDVVLVIALFVCAALVVGLVVVVGVAAFDLERGVHRSAGWILWRAVLAVALSLVLDHLWRAAT